MTDQQGNVGERPGNPPGACPSESRRAFGPILLLLMAVAATLFSLICSAEGPLHVFNYMVIGPLWATAAVLNFKGRARFVLAVVGFVVPATVLTMFQTAIYAARTHVSTRMQTTYAIYNTLERLQQYMQEHRQAPANLKALPPGEGPYGKSKDAWGLDLQYSVDRDGVIVLGSLGADNKPGGDHEDADIIMRFRTRNADGTLNIDDDHWISNARIR